MLVVDGEKAHEIWEAQQARALAGSYTDQARLLGQERSRRLGDRVINQFTREQLLEVFQEPDFQALLTKAQIGAAQTDDDVDHSVLASMLADRARKGNVRKRRIGLDRAIEVADKIDLPALKALTCIFLYSRTYPTGGFIKAGLESQDSLYQLVLADEELPPGPQFMDHLDLLNMVRVNTLSKFNGFDTFWLTRVPGWYAGGHIKSDPMVEEAWQGFARRGLTLGSEILLSHHELDVDRFRLLYGQPEALRTGLTGLNRYSNVQIDSIMAYAAETFGLTESGDPSLKPKLLSMIDEQSTMGTFRRWFEALPYSFTFTAAGTIMARAYAEHCGVAERVNGWAEMDVE
ncbi:MAG: hypothetical protein KAG80_17325 [Nocardioides sp.]|nr:hypothetical protein [Nocardioides sp.]